ncbi:MAG: hypothetical protein U9P80_01480, partial [Thermodesulfobacteriota bacterium]|nr:hypothetical protein [Thermodesulfobacteriota bacterium]
MTLSKTFDLKYLVIAVITLALGACAHTGDQAKLSAPEQVQDQDPYLNMVCARYAQLNKEWDKALRLYTGVDDPLARLEEARIYFILDNNQAAMDKLDVLIEKKDYLDEALGLRMKIYAKMHQWNMALNDAQALLEENPDNPDLKLFIARLRIITADYAGARDLLEKIPTDRKTTMIYYALSKACVGEKSFLCAQKALEAIVSSDRTYKPAYVDLGAIYKMFGQDCK